MKITSDHIAASIIYPTVAITAPGLLLAGLGFALATGWGALLLKELMKPAPEKWADGIQKSSSIKHGPASETKEQWQTRITAKKPEISPNTGMKKKSDNTGKQFKKGTGLRIK